MGDPRTRAATLADLAAPPVAPVVAWLGEAFLVLLLAAIPPLAPSADRGSAMILAGAASAGAWSLFQKGSRAQRLSRGSWAVFLAASAGVHLAFIAADPEARLHGIRAAGVAAAAVGAGGGIITRLGGLAASRRAPRLPEAHDWAAVLCLGILGVIAAAFLSMGAVRGAWPLAEPAVITAMLLLVRGVSGTFARARRLARATTVFALIGLVVWGITR